MKENKKPENSNENEVIAPADDQSYMTGTQYCADGNNANSSPAMMEEETHTPVRKVSYCGQYIADDEENERRVKVRKISTSVPSPSYKGFVNFLPYLFFSLFCFIALCHKGT